MNSCNDDLRTVAYLVEMTIFQMKEGSGRSKLVSLRSAARHINDFWVTFARIYTNESILDRFALFGPIICCHPGRNLFMRPFFVFFVIFLITGMG